MGRSARGVRAMRIKDEEKLVSMAIVLPNSQVLTITQNGFGKRTDINEYRLQSRGGQGVKAGEFNDKTGDLVGLHQISEDNDILLITNNGMTIRITADSIRKISRTSMGVRMMKLRSTNKIVDVAIVPADDEVIEEAENAEQQEQLQDADGQEEVITTEENEINVQPEEEI